MHKFFGGLLILTGLLISCTTDTVVQNRRLADDQHAISSAMQSVVALVERTEQGLTSPLCTAFFVGPRLLATAYHCVEIPQTREIELAPGIILRVPIEEAEPTIGSEVIYITQEDHLSFIRNFDRFGEPNTHRAIVIQGNPVDDVALLRLADEELGVENWFRMAQNLPVTGEKVYEIGMPRSQFWILTEGMVSSIREFPSGRKVIVHQAHVSPGASGSPVFNNSGQVVGVTTAYSRGTHYIGFATPISSVQQLIQTPFIVLGEPKIESVTEKPATTCENIRCPLPETE